MKKKKVDYRKLLEELNEDVEETLEEPVEQQEPVTKQQAVLFPGILPDPFEPNEQVLAMGVVDLRSLRSALHLMMLQCQVALGSIEQLEYTQKQVQERVKKKEV